MDVNYCIFLWKCVKNIEMWMERGRQRRGGRKMWVCVAEPRGMHSFNWTIKCLISVSIFYVCRKRRLECINTQVSLHANVSTDNAPEMIHWWSCEVIWIVIQLDLTELQLSDEFWIQNMSTSVTPLTYFPSFSLTHWPCLQVDLNHVWCLSQTGPSWRPFSGRAHSYPWHAMEII